jgi:hypothetical protein
VICSPLTVGFDSVFYDRRSRALSVSPPLANTDRPVWNYWFPLLSWLSRGSIRPVPVDELYGTGDRYIYPVELRFEVDEWCAETSANERLVILPPSVERALSRGQVLIVLSLMHEGRALWDAQADQSALLLDRVAAFAMWYGLSADQLWLLSGNLDAPAQVEIWRQDRRLSRLPFTLRSFEPFSAFTGACVRESLLQGRAPVAEVSFTRLGLHKVGWQSVRVSWARAPFPGLGSGPATDPARFRYACLNRMFRVHRWQVLNRLWKEELLEHGLVSFPVPEEDTLSEQNVDRTGTEARQLLAKLPLAVDRRANPYVGDLCSENTAYVTLQPPAVLRECAMEIVTETVQAAGSRFVSEKTFKALLGRGPAAVIGTRGTLAYLQSLGVQTWPDQLDEQYDAIADPSRRLASAMDAAVRFIRQPGWPAADAHATRSSNLRWLIEARKPWDAVVSELSAVLQHM